MLQNGFLAPPRFAALALLALLYTFPSHAQTPPPYLLDDVPGALGAYGFELLRADYPGPLVRVRRGSGTFERDIGLSNAAIDEHALEAFLDGDPAFAARLYDQSGHGAHARQNVPARQPRLVDAPNGRKLLAFDGARGLESPDAYQALSGAQALTLFLVARWDGTPSQENLYLANAGRFRPGAGDYPLALYLKDTRVPESAGRLTAELKLNDGTLVELTAPGTFGQAGAFEIYELVFEGRDRVALYADGRLVAEQALSGQALSGQALLQAPPYQGGFFLGTNGNYDYGFHGQLAPPLLFRRALGADERAQVRQALADYYGLSLPGVGPPTGDEITIMFLPDTQRYAAEEEGARASQMQAVMDWIARNREAWKIRLVLHPGDVVEHGREPTEWQNAEAWFSTLEATQIPYAVAVGNHDYQNEMQDRTTANFNRVFSPERYRASSWWQDGGFFEADKSDNLYYLTEIAGTKYLVMTLEFHPRSAVVDWAGGVLRAHPDHRAILVTHDFMNEAARFDEATYNFSDATSSQAMYNRLMSRHENIFLVLSGHHARGTSRRYDAVTGAHYLFFDPMLSDWGHEGWIRAMVYSPSRGTIRVVTYSPSLDEYRTDYQNLFVLDTPYSTEETVGSGEEDNVIPEDFTLQQNYPNPFNPSTQIEYGLPEAQAVRLVVYDVLGRRVEVLVDGFQQGGLHTVTWSADHLPSGMYLYSLQAGSTTLHRSMVLAK